MSSTSTQNFPCALSCGSNCVFSESNYWLLEFGLITFQAFCGFAVVRFFLVSFCRSFSCLCFLFKRCKLWTFSFQEKKKEPILLCVRILFCGFWFYWRKKCKNACEFCVYCLLFWIFECWEEKNQVLIFSSLGVCEDRYWLWFIFLFLCCL